MKNLFLAATILLLASLSQAVLADDVTLGGFDPTGSPTASVSDELAQNAALRNTLELLQDKNDPVGGNPHGNVTLIEFFDYRCPHCVRMFPALQSLISQHANLRVVYKMFPVLGPSSELAARAVLAANMQGKFSPFHFALMNGNGDLSIENIYRIANSIGLNFEKFKSDMNSQAVEAMIIFNSDLAQRMGVNGTPAIFIAKSNLNANSSVKDVIFIEGEATLVELQEDFVRLP